MKYIKLLFFAFIFLTNNNYTFSQASIEKDIKINWSDSIFENIELQKSNLIFDKEIPSDKYQGLNSYELIIPLNTNQTIDIEVSNIKSDIINYTKAPSLDTSFTYSINYLSSRGHKRAQIIFEVFKKNNNHIEALKSIHIKVNIKTNYKINATKGIEYAQNSVLSNGDWYKVRIQRDGIYRLSVSDLNSMGFSTTNLNINYIRVYGNGGGMLPEANSITRYDDLMENDIKIYDINGNGFFDNNDYLLFYGKGPQDWYYKSSLDRFYHRKNIYDDYAYYFITIKKGSGKRIINDTNTYSNPNVFVNSFTDFQYHENDSLNLIKTGKQWYGEQFDVINSYSFSFNFPNIDNSYPVIIRTNMIARSILNSTMFCRANNKERTYTFPAVSSNYLAPYASIIDDTLSFKTNSSAINIKYIYSKPNSSAQAWLNFIEVNAHRHLTMTGNQLIFRNTSIIGTGNTAEYTLENANQNIEIWEISNYLHPIIIHSNLNSNTLKFVCSSDSLKTFIAHYGGYTTPEFVGEVKNQNLHNLKNIDYVIIYNSKFKKQAEELANFHRVNSNLTVFTTEAKEIYNEFSSGAKDITAIRDFMRMLYSKANNNVSTMPKYLLLFGDASYDYKNRVPNNTNLVPTYESSNSLAPTGSYCTDDYYGLLDNNEGYSAFGDLDIGIGRFPVTTTEEANTMISKIKRYLKPENDINSSSSCANGNNQIKAMADWRNIFCFIGDDGDNKDGPIHMSQANYLADYIGDNYPEYNIDKILFDAYPQVITPGGQRYPQVNQAINQRVTKGALVINYTGHGGEEGWAHESVLEVKDINAWKNYNNMPLFVTATCEFSRYDDPGRVSAGELVILNSNGGGIGLLTTSRVAFSSSNFNLSKALYKNILKKTNGKYPSIGDLIRLSKIGAGSVRENRNFVLLGDPALCISIPSNNIVTNNIVDVATDNSIDTLFALQTVKIEGEIQNNGQLMSNYNGIIYPTIFDKSQILSTLNNDGDIPNFKFKSQKNILYKGKAKVENGKFNFTFVVPKDISYNYGIGKISYYSTNDTIDANGYNNNFDIGGSYINADTDVSGPQIELHINDSLFISGGITDENPILLARLFDEHGVNTIGNGIGHDITAILDQNSNQPIILNDYYQANLDNYKRGSIKFPFKDLEDGYHTLSIKVWDVYNNSAEDHIDFIVGSNQDVIMENLVNAPNPFYNKTSFIFDHNQGCDFLDVQVLIFDINGRFVRELNATVNSSGYRVGPNQLVWDGNSNSGRALSKGIYVYKVRIKNSDGSYKEMSNKMLLLR